MNSNASFLAAAWGGVMLLATFGCGPGDDANGIPDDAAGVGGAAGTDAAGGAGGSTSYVEQPCPERPGTRYRNMCFSQVTETAGLAYAADVDADGEPLVDVDGAPLALDLFTPKDDPGVVRPTIVLAHGGGFTAGSRKDANIRDLCRTFALHGYACASISYRLAASGVSAQAVKNAQGDMKAAVRWLRDHADAYALDVTRFAVGGGSAGAVTALHSAYLDDEGSSGTPAQSSAVRAVLDLWGAYFGDSATAMDPLTSGDPPMMIVHGENDATFGVNYARAEELFEASKTTGVPSRFYTIRDVGHSPWKCSDNIAAKALDFFYAYLVAGSGDGVQMQEDLPCIG